MDNTAAKVLAAAILVANDRTVEGAVRLVNRLEREFLAESQTTEDT